MVKDCPLDSMRCVGIDPGLRDFLVGVVEGDNREEPDLIRCSTAEYWERAGFVSRKHWQEARLHRAPNLLEQWQC